MGTTPPRKFSANVAHCVRGRINFNDTGVTTGIEIGKIPAASFIQGTYVSVDTVFNAATTNVVKVGSPTTADLFATSTEIGPGVAGPKARAIGTATTSNIAADTSVMVLYTQTGTAATTGIVDVMVVYYPYAS